MRVRLARIAPFVVASGLGVGGCATPVFNPATNEPLSAATPPNMGAPEDVMRENSVVLSFSGGGLRAAAFAHGVLTALASVRTPDGDLLDDVTMISAVSGGALTAAHYGVFGREGVARFRNDVLLSGFESGMRLTLNPVNLMRVMGGGLNARENFAEALDSKVFRGATFADIYRRPRTQIRIQGTDLYHRVPFPFLPPVFEVLCSDLSRYSVADAVAASMAVPVVFAPMVIRSYPGNCRPLPEFITSFRPRPEAPRLLNAIARAITAYRDPRIRYIKIADGGLTDNFGASTLTMSRMIYGTPYAPMTERDAVGIRRLLVVVVDASQAPHGEWTHNPEGPRGLELALSATDAAIDAAAQHAADAFGAMIEHWQASVIKYRCGLGAADLKRLGAPARWDCRDVKFAVVNLAVGELASPARERIEAVPTRLTLEPAQVDAAIDGAREGLLALPRLQGYLRERLAPVQ